jgi:transposase InsO family protein
MTWNNRGLMSLKEEFVKRVQRKEETVSELCKIYNISRKTAYKWINRYSNEGLLGLNERSKRPGHMPTRITSEQTQLILSKRDKHPSWGAKKIKQVLVNAGYQNLPSISSFNRVLHRQGKIAPEETKKRQQFIRFERENPNELWQMDFKGYFSVREGNCHPLTILDDCSRYSICLRACLSESEIVVRGALQEAFREYGLPDSMTMDNGSPWKGYPSQRLSKLTVWLMRLGIKVGHSRPNHPQTQGKDERFHRTFKEEVLKYHNFQNLLDAQEHFDEWRHLYNHIRPHEALGMLCPAQKYRKSKRLFPEKLLSIEYQSGDEVRRVRNGGEICFKGKYYYIGEHLKGESVALRYREDRKWDVYYVNSRIVGFEEKV